MVRAVRIAGWSLLALLALALALICVLIVFGNTPPGRHFIERETAELTAGRVRVEGLGGTFPWSIGLRRLEVSDPHGVWMTARSVSVEWSPLALLAWELHVERFDVGRAVVARRPVSAASSSARRSHSHLPAIDIDRLQIGELELAPAAAGVKADLTIEGSLHYRSSENLQASIDARRTNGRGRYALSVRIAHAHMSAAIDVHEPAGGPLEHLLSVPGLGALSVKARLAGPPEAETLRLDARAGKLRASAGGTIDLERRAANLSYSLTSPPMTPRPGLSWRRIALKGTWRGPLAAAHAEATADLAGLRLPGGARLGSLRAALAANGRRLTLQAVANGVVLAGAAPALLAGSPLTLKAVMHLDAAGRPLRLTLTQRLFELRARAVTAGARSASFALELPDLAPLAAIEHQSLSGSVSLSGKLAENGAATRIEASAHADLQGASIAARLLGPDTRLHLAATVTSAAIEVERLELAGRALRAHATGHAERSRAAAPGVRSLSVHWRAHLPDLALISRSYSGSLETDGTAHGPLHSLSVEAKIRSRVAIHGSPPGEVEATLHARGLPSASSAVLEARGTFDEAPLRLNASVGEVARDTFHVDLERATWKSLAINGNLTAGPDLAAAQGALSLRVGRLADFAPLLGTPLRGSIQGRVALGRLAGLTQARIELAARKVEAAGIAGDARLSAVGPIGALRVRLLARSHGFHGGPASLAAAGRLDMTTRALTLERLEGRFHGQTVRLISPARVLFARGISVRDLRLTAQRAVLALDGELSPALDFSASIHHLDARLIDAFVPHLLAQGTLNADAHLTGSRAAPVGRAALEIAHLKLADAAAAGLPAINVRGSASFEGRTARVFAQLAAGATTKLRLSGRAPLAAAGAVALKLEGRMNAALMNSVLEARGERAAGRLTVDATVTGTAAAPRITGAVQLTNGDLRDYTEGVHLDDINARLVGRRGVLRIVRMSARAGPGELTATGTIGVLERRVPIHVSLEARNIQPITNDILTANLDTHIEVAGDLRRRTDVTGTIQVNHASISVPNGFPPSVARLHVIRPGEAPRPPPERRLVVGLDISLVAPDAIFVHGRGLDAQLGGKLRVEGTAATPQVSGGFSMLRGTFSLAGTSLVFTRGLLSFSGSGLRHRIDPTLDFIAQSSVMYYSTATTVTLRVTGLATSPKISLSSTPKLPQSDLLALLLFGKPASQLSAFQVAETGAALGSLAGAAGAGSSWNPLTWLRRGLGLNTLAVGSAPPPNGAGAGGAAANGASITAGKYVSNRVYVAATQTTTGTSQLRVDVDLSPHLTLQTRLGNGTATAQGVTPQDDPGSSIGLSYHIEY